jgi:hypothetical protein
MNKARAGASGVILDQDVSGIGNLFWGISWKTEKKLIKCFWTVLSARMQRYRSTA